MDDIRPLFERDDMTDEEMVAYLAHCMIDSKHPRASIETLAACFPAVQACRPYASGFDHQLVLRG